MATFSIVLVIALALGTAVRFWLGLRHARHVTLHRNQVPPEFADDISPDAHRKAADYTCAKTRFGLVATGFDAVILLLFTLGGGLQWLHDLSAGWFSHALASGVTLIVLYVLVTAIVDIPFSWYGSFVLEQRFGFNKMTPKTFVTDLLKHAAVAALLGIPLVTAVLWVMQQAGAWWWLYAWLIWITFNLAVLAIYPTWIAPLFNKFSPLNDVQMKARIETLLEKCGFKVQGLMVMDGSRRSSHGNAYFTGFGRSKRIVFFDTLLSRLQPQEVEAVLAHELGHYKLKHVIKRIAWLFLLSLTFLWLLAQLMIQDWFYLGLGVQSPSTAMALILFFTVLPHFTFPFQPIASLYSRKHEFEADQYASQYARAGDLITGLVKLYKDNASTLTPDPLHSAFYDSHPPAMQRIARLKQLALTP